MVTRNGTKTTMKRQRTSLTKEERIYRDVKKFAKDEKIAKTLIEKYGVDCAYTIVRKCMQEPANVLKRINPNVKLYKTSDAIKFFAGANLNDTHVARGINKTPNYVKQSKLGKNTTPAATASKTKVEAKTKAKTVATKTKTITINKTTSSNVTTTPNMQSDKAFDFNWSNPILAANNTTPFSMPTSPTAPQTIEQQIEFEMQRLKKENPQGVTLKALKEDGYQINNKTIAADDLKHLTAGPDGKGLAGAVKKSTNVKNGKNSCGRAVRLGYTDYMNRAHKEMKVPTNESEFYGRRENGKLIWGSRAAATLYKKFDTNYFSVLTYPSHKGGNSELNNVPEGATVFFDKPAGRKITLPDGSKIDHPGHVASYCDGKWWQGSSPQTKETISGAHYAAYGKNYRVAIANDTRVNDELLRKMVRQRIEENQRNQNNVRTTMQNSSGGR